MIFNFLIQFAYFYIFFLSQILLQLESIIPFGRSVQETHKINLQQQQEDKVMHHTLFCTDDMIFKSQIRVRVLNQFQKVTVQTPQPPFQTFINKRTKKIFYIYVDQQELFFQDPNYYISYKHLSMRPYKNERKLNLTLQQYQNHRIQKGYIILNRYEIISKLGQGAYAQVYEAHDNQMQVAIKIINLNKLYSNYQIHTEEKKKQILLMEESNTKKINQINSEHIVKYCQSFINKEGTIKVIIMERCQGPTLSNYIYNLRKQRKGLTEQQSLRYIYQIALGINDLHEIRIIHRDLHPGNIMLHKGKLMIIDLGFSLGNNFTGAPQFLDMEKLYGMKIYVWSLGIILFYLLTAGKYPFKINRQNLDHEIMHTQLKQALDLQFKEQNRSKSKLQKSKVTEKTRNFIKKLLCINHQQRYNIKQVLNDSIFDFIRSNNGMVDQKDQREKEQALIWGISSFWKNFMDEQYRSAIIDHRLSS